VSGTPSELEIRLRWSEVSRGSAKPYTVAILIALELLVVDTDEQFYKRLIAWTMLMSVWACMRVDDVQCIKPESMRSDQRVQRQAASHKDNWPGEVTWTGPCIHTKGLHFDW